RPCLPSGPRASGARPRDCPRPGVSPPGGRSCRYRRSCFSFLNFRKRENERAASAVRGLDPDPSAMAVDHLLAYREADPGTGVFIPGMQPLEHHEDTLEVLLLDADTVVGDRKTPFAFQVLEADVDAHRLVLLPELDRVADQILEELRELRVVGTDLGK